MKNLKIYFIYFAFVCLSLFSYITHAQDKTDFNANLLRITGHSEISVIPDQVEVTIGGQADSNSARLAQKKVNEILNSLVLEMKELGIKESEMQTVESSVNANRDYNSKTQKIVSYTAVSKIKIKIQGRDRFYLLSEAIEKANSMSAINIIESMNFSVSDKLAEEKKQEALKLAGKNALDNAKAVLSELGLSLVNIYSIDINNIYIPSPVYDYRMTKAKSLEAFDSAGSATPVLAGEQKISADLNLSIKFK